MVVARGWWTGREGVVNGCRVPVREDERFLETVLAMAALQLYLRTTKRCN